MLQNSLYIGKAVFSQSPCVLVQEYMLEGQLILNPCFVALLLCLCFPAPCISPVAD